MPKVKTILAGVADASVFAGSDLLLEAKALTESSISIGLTAEEIRGGKGAQLVGRYFHSSSFEVTLTDVLFQMEYIALNVGSKIDPADIGELTTEEVVGENNKITIAGTATDFMGQGVLGWYTPVGAEDWKTITFNEDNKTATANGVVADTKYCVKYMNNASCESITISADFTPDEVSLVLKADLFKASKGEGLSTASKIGVAEIEVPRFQLNGTMELNLNMTGAAQTPLSGQALSTQDGVQGCAETGYYARIKKIVFDSKWTDNLTGLAANPSSVSVAQQTSTSINVYGVFKGANASSKLIDPAELKYTVDPASGLCTVDKGVITGETVSTTQKGTITVTVKNATGDAAKVSTVIPVTVTP